LADAQQFDVAIIGAGIAGSALALALSRSDLSIALVEAQALERPQLPEGCSVTGFDARVSALTPRSVSLLQRLDAWEPIVDYRQCAYRHMTVWDGQGTGRIEFDCSEVGVPALGHIVENRAIVDALLARVMQRPAITCFSPDRLEGCVRQSGAKMTLSLGSGVRLEAELLVGADGALSRVRDMLKFDTREWDYGHHALVATVQVERAHGDTAWQRFLPSGPLALLPLPADGDAHYCSIVWSVQEALVDDLLSLNDARFRAALGEAFESTLGTVIATSERFAFPLRQRHAVDYVQPGVALVADAAHTIHPLAGQGINLGLQDVEALADELLSACARGVSPGEVQLLRRYQRRRKGENLLMMGAMDGFKRLFEQDALPLRWLRNAGMRTVGRLPPLKQQLMRHAMGIG